MFVSLPFCLPALMFTLALSPGMAAEKWRSSLYPDDWKPGYADAEGRFLQDFSYAGYHRGEKPLPVRTDNVVDVTQAPYSADATGKTDATAAIQAALEDVGKAGGGIVFLPSGTFRVAPAEESKTALKIQHDNVVLRGAGTDRTFLFNDTTAMNNKIVIEVKPPSPAWWFAEGKWAVESPAREDLAVGCTVIPVENSALFAAGDLVAVRNDWTDRLIEELGMTGKWTRENLKNRAVVFCRRITGVDAEKNTVTIDVPVRYDLKKADNARVVKLSGRMLSEVGLEDFSMGMKEHPATEFGDHDYFTPGTPSYDVHQSFLIVMEGVENCWIQRVNSFLPEGNAKGFHIISNGIKLARSRFVTVADCVLKTAQYQGGGGNGYPFTVNANECLLRNCRAELGRHNFDFQNTTCSGNVWLDCTTVKGQLPSDFHMYFSVANLIDNMTCEEDFVEAVFRPYGGVPMHGVTTTQSVFWNTHGVSYPKRKPIIVESKQFGLGYVIGTRGPASAVDSDDFVEGVGKGDTLEPRSLYLDQLSRRLRKSH